MKNLLSCLCALAMIAGCGSKQPEKTPEPANTTVNATPKPTDSAEPKADTPEKSNVFTHKDGGIQFEVPAGWKTEPKGDILSIVAPDGSCSIVFWVLDDISLEAAVNEVDKRLAKVMTNIQLKDEPKKALFGDMRALVFTGSGAINGQPIGWDASIVAAKKLVLAVSFAEPGSLQRYQAEIQAFFKSMKKLG